MRGARGGRGGNHEFFSGNSQIRSSPRPVQNELRRETAAKPGIQVLSRPKEEEKKPIVIAARPTSSISEIEPRVERPRAATRVTPSPREEPSEKIMLDSRRLISDTMLFEESILEYLTDNPHFSVTAAIGPQNSGKSTILSMLAGNNPQDKYRHYVFRPASREAVESSRYQTLRIYAYISKARGIFLDCQPTNSASMVEDTIKHSRKIDEKSEITAYVENIQLIAFLLQVSNTVLVCSDYTLDMELVKILRTAEMIRPNLNRFTNSALPQLNFVRKTNIVFVHTRATSIDFSYEFRKERVQLIRSLFADSLRLRISDKDNLVLMMLAVLKPRKDTTTQMYAQAPKERSYDTEEIESFEDGIREMRLLLAGIPRDPFSEQSFSEKQWLLFARTVWKDSSFISAIEKLSSYLG